MMIYVTIGCVGRFSACDKVEPLVDRPGDMKKTQGRRAAFAALAMQPLLAAASLAGEPPVLALLAYQVRWWAVAAALVLLTLWARRKQTWVAVAATVSLLLVGLSLVLGQAPIG